MKEMSDFFVASLPLFQSVLLIGQALLMREMLLRMKVTEDRLRVHEALMTRVVNLVQSQS
jgi:hypothetical protein